MSANQPSDFAALQLLLLLLLLLLKTFAEFLWLVASKDNHSDKLKQVFDDVLSPNQHCQSTEGTRSTDADERTSFTGLHPFLIHQLTFEGRLCHTLHARCLALLLVVGTSKFQTSNDNNSINSA